MTSVEITTNEIFAQDTITSNHSITNIDELYNELVNSKSNPISKYEFYDTNTLNFMKIVVDIDLVNKVKKELDKYDDNDVIDNTSEVLRQIFGVDINIIHTTHHRSFYKKGKSYKQYKKSYHLIVDNKKINPMLLGKIMRKYQNKFKYKIDTSIYPVNKGQKKFRLPLTIKETEKPGNKKISIMKMSLPETADNFKKYCISKTTGLDEVEPLVQVEEEVEIEQKEPENNVWDFYPLNFVKYNRILDKYKHHSIDKKKNTWICDIECKCPFGVEHSTNKRYLTLNFLTNSIYIKCHSDRCKDKTKMLLDNVFTPLNEFSLSIFLQLEDYSSQKKYFEKRVIYLSDTNKYKKIKYDRHNNKFLEDINFLPIGNSPSCYYDKKSGELIQSAFGKCYYNDKYRKIYNNTTFYPNYKDAPPHYYNEFQGFGYEKVLSYDIDKKEVKDRQQENLHFYINFLLKYVCGNDKKVLNYFLSLLSYYIKYPQQLNHIILVLYSNEQGTGKSSFLDFFMRIIGVTYGCNTEIEQVLDKHSNLSYKKLINVIEELEYENGKNYSKKLKNRSQAESTTLNEKNEPMRTIANFVHYIITTNEYRSIPLEPNDRRHFILEFVKIYNDDKLVNRIDDLYNNEEFIFMFGDYLRNRPESFDYSRIILWEKKRPMTDLYKIMIKRDSIDTFFTKMLRYEYHEGNKIGDKDDYNYYVKDKIDELKITEDNDIIVSKYHLYEMYDRRNKRDKKFAKDSFNTNILDIKKLVKEVEVDDEIMFMFDITKCRNHLKLNEDEVTLLELLKIMYDDDLPEKIKIKETSAILKR